ncbi:probable G-protein coupled receptor 139 [Heterodontus francisci]|uniref:probable G-protein coupled receptor 139 n=1 Tax=Heterodontus francisci TaxID=7792 RepID=UPI00355C7163
MGTNFIPVVILKIWLQASPVPGQALPVHLPENVEINLISIVILSRGKCSLSKCITLYLSAMVVTDLLVIITEVILFRISNAFFPGSLLSITPVCSVIAVLTRASRDSSVWLTITFSFDRFVAICCQKQKTKYCTKKTASVVIATTCILLSLKSTVWYFIYEPQEIIENVAWFCNIKPSYFTELGWVAFDWFDTILTPMLPFALILLLNALTVRHILVTSRVRKGLRGQNKGENHVDSEMESRKKSIILLFAISGSFILLWLTDVTGFLYYITAETILFEFHSLNTFRRVGYMLQCLSSCTNTFIYVLTQGKFRQQFKSVMKYPIIMTFKLVGKN